MVRGNILFSILFLSTLLSGQNHLESYKKDFVKEHTELRAAQLDIDYSQLEYEKSKRDRYPSLTLNAQYDLRNGGREYEIPTGTLLNPVYNNLTYLNSIHVPPDGTSTYPKDYDEVENSSINFLRTKEYDARLTASIPLINFSTRGNINIKNLEQNLAKLEYDRIFIEEWTLFKINYFSYFKREALIKLLEVNRDRTESFYAKIKSRKDADKLIKNRLKKVELDKLKIQIDIKEQRALLENDKNYLLDVLNKEDKGTILIDKLDLDKYRFTYTKKEIVQMWSKNNVNLKLINQRSEILERRIMQSRNLYKPNLDFAFSTGLQGEGFGNDEKPLYMIGSLRLNWNLYNPKKRIEDKQIATVVEKSIIENKTIEKNTRYEIEALFDKVKLEWEKFEYNEKNVSYNELKKFEIERKYEEGKATYYEVYNVLLDVENAKVDYTMSKFDYLILVCKLEKLIGVELFE